MNPAAYLNGEFLALIGGFVASAFALVRFSLSQSRSMIDGFVSFLERSLRSQEELNQRLANSLAGLGDVVRLTSANVERVLAEVSAQRR